MSRLNELLTGLSSGDVPVRPLGELGEFIRGRRFTKADYVESGLGSIHYGEIYTDFGTSASVVHRFVRPELRRSLRLARKGDLVIAATGENVQDVCKAVAWLGNEEIAVHDDCYIFRHNLDPTFAAFLFQSAQFQEQKRKLASESKLARVSGVNLAKIVAPVPPLEVQQEVVSVLNEYSDLHSRLLAELEAELVARRDQFVHYRDSLLTFGTVDSLSLSLSEQPIRWARLSELFDMRAGKFIAASSIVSEPGAEHPIPCFGGGGLRGYVALASHHGDRVLIGRQGALCGNVKRASGEFYATEHAVVVTARPEVDIRWAFHMLKAMNLNQYASKSAQPGLAVGTIERLEIPVPPYVEQRRVGRALDKLDAFVTDISAGLTAEIAARRQQYEYCRDKLLTFEAAA